MGVFTRRDFGECMSHTGKNATLALLLILFILGISGCATPVTPVTRTPGNIITGTITAGSLLLFPQQSIVEIYLIQGTVLPSAAADDGQESIPDSVEIARQIIKNPQVNPIKFSLRYDPEDVQDFQTYTVHVQVLDRDENILYATLAGIPVITKNYDKKIDARLVLM